MLALGLGACGDEAPKQAPIEPSKGSMAVQPKKPSAPVVAPPPAPVVPKVEVPKPDPGAAAVAPKVEVPKPAPAPASIDDAMKQAAALDKSGDREEAIAVLHAGVARWPKNATARVELARLYLGAGEPGRAKPHAEKATELRADWSTAWNTLGRAELGMARFEDAIAAFERAIEANEENRYAWNNLGHTLILLERWEDAVAALEHAVDGEEVEPYMWNNLGMALENLDRLDQARAAYEQGAAAGSTLAASNRQRIEGMTQL
ncbi:MAG: tetratricopeptide repeat protein [Deltaproteobacteria bacterium]|nr:tetratricopeptide repeat protein [Kofleriaceae bacterium]